MKNHPERKAIENKVTVIVLNWLRSEQLRKDILPIVSSYPIVNQVIVSHGRNDTIFSTPNLSNVSHLNHSLLNQSYGLSRRFISALGSQTECVLFIDDDLLPNEDTIVSLYEKWKQMPDKVYGIIPRFFFLFGDRFYYSFWGSSLFTIFKKLTGKSFTRCDTILTSCAMTSKTVAEYALDCSEQLMSWAKINTNPLWNGEDILLSLCSLKLTSCLPQAHFLKVKIFPDLKKNIAISSTKKHFKIRSQVVNKVHELLNIKNGYPAHYSSNLEVL